jgi:Spy/CpxP family protein refolding chaperone
MSYGVQSAGLFGSLSIDGSTSTSLRPFSNLDLTEDQRAQVRSILKNAKSEGLTQDQIEQEINSILTPTQQATFQSDQASVSSSDSSAAASSSGTQSASTQPNPFTDSTGPFANLDLTSSQQSQVSQILSNAQSEGLTFSQVNSQISAILTTTQQTSFESDLASLPTAGGNSSQSDGSSSTASNPASSVQQQIAAAAALILQQIEQDISNQSSTSSSSGSASSSGSSTQSTQNAPNPFTDPNGPFANLNLTQDQQTQISQILSSAQSQGLTFDQINSEINGVLTSSQQTTFSSDLASLPSAPNSSGTSASGATTSSSSNFSVANIQQQIEAAAEAILQQIEQSAQSTNSSANSSSTVASTSDSTQPSQSAFNPFTDPNGPFANLNLTSDQQSLISQILSSAQSQGLTPEEVNSQIGALLSTAQQAAFGSDLASLQLPTSSGGSSDASTATASVSGQSQDGSDGTIASSTTATERQIQRQIAAAESLILQQIQYGLENPTT